MGNTAIGAPVGVGLRDRHLWRAKSSVDERTLAPMLNIMDPAENRSLPEWTLLPRIQI
jgi:hypothetical protein